MPQADAAVRWTDLRIEPLTQDAFAPFGTVLDAQTDGEPFGAACAALDLSRGTPRFYTMRIPGGCLSVKHITRHCKVTQALAAAGGHSWVMAVAPPLDIDVPDAEPALADIHVFRIPGDVAIALHRGTWHAGPLFEATEASFFNLELADTNVVDHQTCDLMRRYGTALRLVN